MTDAGALAPDRGAAAIRWLRSVRARRAVFLCFWAMLFVGTHWPHLELNVPNIERPDLLVHLTIFGALAALLIAAAVFDPALSVRNILLSGLAAALYASADEASQLIPIFQRHAAWDDWALNLSGITAAVIAAFICRLTLSRTGPRTGPR